MDYFVYWAPFLPTSFCRTVGYVCFIFIFCFARGHCKVRIWEGWGALGWGCVGVCVMFMKVWMAYIATTIDGILLKLKGYKDTPVSNVKGIPRISSAFMGHFCSRSNSFLRTTNHHFVRAQTQTYKYINICINSLYVTVNLSMCAYTYANCLSI